MPKTLTTTDALAEYCRRVASAVGLACIHVWGFQGDGAYALARKCGVAFQVTNIFAWRDTDPFQMRKAKDPIGPGNDAAILAGVARADQVIAAWGTHGAHMNRGPQMTTLLQGTGKPLYTLGLSKHGHPKHPLYISYSQQPMLWQR